MLNMNSQCKVFNIQRFSTHDGPGIRTVIFLKGCPLRCKWCSNPESQSIDTDIWYNSIRCIGCGRCVEACPHSIPVGRQGVDERCEHCNLCVAACPSMALELVGEEKGISEIMEEVRKDAPYYINSGGGVTISGGELLMHPSFSMELMDNIKKEGFHVAIETTGFATWEIANKVFAKADLILYDMKHMDDKIHQIYTGVSNKIILENARLASKQGYNIIFRVPLIGGVNADEDNIKKLGAFANETGVKVIHLLPYHSYGESKYRFLRKDYDFKGYKPSIEEIEKLTHILEMQGIKVLING